VLKKSFLFAASFLAVSTFSVGCSDGEQVPLEHGEQFSEADAPSGNEELALSSSSASGFRQTLTPNATQFSMGGVITTKGCPPRRPAPRIQKWAVTSYGSSFGPTVRYSEYYSIGAQRLVSVSDGFGGFRHSIKDACNNIVAKNIVQSNPSSRTDISQIEHRVITLPFVLF